MDNNRVEEIWRKNDVKYSDKRKNKYYTEYEKQKFSDNHKIMIEAIQSSNIKKYATAFIGTERCKIFYPFIGDDFYYYFRGQKESGCYLLCVVKGELGKELYTPFYIGTSSDLGRRLY